MPIPLLALAISAFAIGTTEFVIMGLLPEVARDLAVSIPSAGLLVSGYALGVAVGAPLLAVVTSKMPRKLALQLLMGVFIVGNVLCAMASGLFGADDRARGDVVRAWLVLRHRRGGGGVARAGRKSARARLR